MKIIWDKTHRVLYITQNNATKSYGDEVGNHLIIRKDWDTDRITGVTLML